ncbi:MAG: HlyD family efflux transporter periplasmic adaptor subunit [Rhizobiales bacterium]|nr:HlyD family efflux transporter periplasmic adaptor subunit [Hyphomicrobiales bacterium]
MIKSLRKRPRPDQLINQQRRATNRTGRLVYLGMLAMLAVAIANYVFGDFIFLRADGLAVRDKVTIATTYIAGIQSIHVEEGDSIAKGAPLMVLKSSQILERLADLSARRARLAAEAADFKIRAETVAKLLPLAERRERATGEIVAAFDQLSNQQLITNARYDEALSANFDARQSLVKMRTENETLNDELTTLDAARADADSALDDLRRYYDGGIVRSPVDGTIGTSIAATGDVFPPGKPMLSIFTGETYVLAYLPRNYLFSIEPGMQVAVTGGRSSAQGVISEILPVADALPQEFQNTFQPRDRSQLARIRFASEPPFPLNEKVRIGLNQPWW